METAEEKSTRLKTLKLEKEKLDPASFSGAAKLVNEGEVFMMPGNFLCTLTMEVPTFRTQVESTIVTHSG